LVAGGRCLFPWTWSARITAALPQRIANHDPFGKATVMWRALFLAVGIYMCILGAECLAVETFQMAADEPAAELGTPATLFGNPPASLARREIEPPEWAPWSFLSAGTVIILYALTINRQG